MTIQDRFNFKRESLQRIRRLIGNIGHSFHCNKNTLLLTKEEKVVLLFLLSSKFYLVDLQLNSLKDCFEKLNQTKIKEFPFFELSQVEIDGLSYLYDHLFFIANLEHSLIKEYMNRHLCGIILRAINYIHIEKSTVLNRSYNILKLLEIGSLETKSIKEKEKLCKDLFLRCFAGNKGSKLSEAMENFLIFNRSQLPEFSSGIENKYIYDKRIIFKDEKE